MKRTCLLALCLVTIVGCTNAPDALTLTLTPAKRTFTPQEPIVVSAVLRAVDGPVCLAKPAMFRVELRREDGGTPMHGQPCPDSGGTKTMLSWPARVLMVPACFLDMADLTDRLAVVGRGGLQPQQFAVLQTDDEHLFVMPIDPQAPADERVMLSIRGSRSLALGKYKLRATLTSQLNPYRWTSHYPLPVFWHLYGHPITAEAAFVVEEGAPPADPDSPTETDTDIAGEEPVPCAHDHPPTDHE